MNYKGKLYGKQGKKYVELAVGTEYVDKIRDENDLLKNALQKIVDWDDEDDEDYDDPGDYAGRILKLLTNKPYKTIKKMTPQEFETKANAILQQAQELANNAKDAALGHSAIVLFTVDKQAEDGKQGMQIIVGGAGCVYDTAQAIRELFDEQPDLEKEFVVLSLSGMFKKDVSDETTKPFAVEPGR